MLCEVSCIEIESLMSLTSDVVLVTKMFSYCTGVSLYLFPEHLYIALHSVF